MRDDEPGVEDGGLVVGEGDWAGNSKQKVEDVPGVYSCVLNNDAQNRVSISEEQMVIDSINETMGFYDVIAKLLDFNHQGKLKKPYIGNLEGTVQVYKTSQD